MCVSVFDHQWCETPLDGRSGYTWWDSWSYWQWRAWTSGSSGSRERFPPLLPSPTLTTVTSRRNMETPSRKCGRRYREPICRWLFCDRLGQKPKVIGPKGDCFSSRCDAGGLLETVSESIHWSVLHLGGQAVPLVMSHLAGFWNRLY